MKTFYDDNFDCIGSNMKYYKAREEDGWVGCNGKVVLLVKSESC